MRKLPTILAIASVVIILSGCGAKLEPEKFSFPLEETNKIELKGAPIFFSGGICITDEGWKADILQNKIEIRKNEKIPPSKKPITIEGAKGKVYGKIKEGNNLYFGTDEGYVYCFRGNNKRWERKIGAGVISRPAIYKNLLLVISLDAHLYCFKKKTGTILWLKKLPGRGKYPPVVIDETIIAPSLSKKIIGFNEKGEKQGSFELEGELKFPLYVKDKKLIAVSYKWDEGLTVIQVLGKKVGVELTITPEPPVKTGDPVEIKAKVYGFKNPVISFYVDEKLLSRGEEKKLLWMAEREGVHKIKVIATEEGLKRESEEELKVIDPLKEWYRKLLEIRKNCYWKR